MSENKRNWFTTNIHELVHFTKQNAAKAYERLENHIIDWFLSENNLGGYESAVEAYMRTYSKSNSNFTRADAKEEITADSIAALFSTKDGAKSFVHYIADTYKQKSKEIFDTFEEWINNIITSINTMLKKDVLSPLQRTVLQMDKKQAMSIRKEFLSALDEAIKNYASSKTEQKNNTADSSAKFSVNPNFKSQYDKWDKKNPRTAFILGSTSNALQSIGIRNADITIDAAKLIKIRNKHSEMTDAVIKQISSIIENPIVVMSSKSMNSRLTMFGQVIKDGKPVLVVLELFPKNKNTINLNEIKVASAYGKKNAQNFINSSNILYIDSNKKRVKNWEKRTGLQLPVGNSSLNSTNNIPNSSDNVNNNVKNSLDVDIEDTNNPTDSTDIRYSLNVNAEVDVDKALNDKYYNQDIVLTDTTPSIVASQKGVNNYPMLMKASHIRENIFTRDEAKNKGYNTGKNINYHGLGKELFLNIISDLDKVQRAYRGTKNAENPSRRENYFLLISQYTDSDGKTINVPVYINEKGKYNRVFIDTNKLATVFGRDDFESYIKRELSKGNLVRIKNRSNQVSEATLAISADYNKITSKDSISNSNKNVNTKLSKDVNFTQSELESLKDENRELRRKNRYLEKANTNLKEQFKLTGGRVLKPNTLNAVAVRIKKEWGTTMSKDEIASRIQQIYERLLDDKENMTWETFLNECTAIAQDAWDNQKAPELDSYAKEILTDIRSSKISLTEEQKKETAYHNDTYRDYLRNNFGNIKIANDGVPLDVKWMEWSEKYPDLFNPEITDLFQHILHLSQNINNR